MSGVVTTPLKSYGYFSMVEYTEKYIWLKLQYISIKNSISERDMQVKSQIFINIS